MRYKLKMWIDNLFGKYNTRCTICERKTNSMEEYYYDGTCEKCKERQMKNMSKELIEQSNYGEPVVISQIEYVIRLLDAKHIKYELLDTSIGKFSVGEHSETYTCSTEPMSKLFSMLSRIKAK